MARDYQRRAQGKRSRKPARGRKRRRKSLQWLWLLGGLLLGLLIAAGGWLVYHNVAQSPQQSPQQERTAPAAAPAPEPDSAAPEQQDRAADTEQHFDFYTLLPKMEVRIPEDSIDEDTSKHIFILQTGSFRRNQDAETMKAQLALLGIEASVQTVVINDDTWHRVRIGPFRTWQEVKPVRHRLKRNDIDFTLLKIRP